MLDKLFTKWDQFTPLQFSLQLFCLVVNFWCKLTLKERAAANEIKFEPEQKQGRYDTAELLLKESHAATWFPDIAYLNLKCFLLHIAGLCIFTPSFSLSPHNQAERSSPATCTSDWLSCQMQEESRSSMREIVKMSRNRMWISKRNSVGSREVKRKRPNMTLLPLNHVERLWKLLECRKGL